MKKIFFVAAVAVSAIFTSCENKKADVSLNTEMDTIAYELGMVSSPGARLIDLLQQMGSDSAFVAEYLKGVEDGASVSDAKALAYELGKQQGLILRNQCSQVSQGIFGDSITDSVNIHIALAALKDVIEDSVKLQYNSVPVSQQQAYYELQGRVAKAAEEREAVKHLPNKKAGEEYLAAKAKEEGVIALSDGVLYKVIKEGKKNGKKPAVSDKIKVAYKGMTIDGQVFDSNDNFEYPLGAMIPGWKIAIPEMTEGSKWEIYIPQELAYGKRGSMPNIKPYSALIFEVEFFGVVSPEEQKK